MGNKMLIDAAHPEETRVVVLRGNRIEEFDFEAANKRQLRGNIYLAKVTRVEPSLQAAFIEYGGNRHGFLAFSEIHPDYYQIPVADRQQLLEDEARSAEEDEEETRPASGGHRRSRRHRRGGNGSAEKRSATSDESVRSEEPAGSDEPGAELTSEDHAGAVHASDDHAGHIADDHEVVPAAHDEAAPDGGAAADDDHEPTPADEPVPASAEPAHEDHDADEHDHEHEHVTTLEGGQEEVLRTDASEAPLDATRGPEGGEEPGHDEEGGHDEEPVEQLGGDALEDVPRRSTRPRRHYKIQEVIKRRQVLLVQVVKEERGNKGAALTTYLSLAGRYSVLMPNTAKGGGISRKIVDPEDRKRLKAIAQELEVPEGMGIILRTAGASRGMPEVKRDFEYLMRMWETVRETTLKSSAPTLVYEEGSLIKRSIRDLFTKDVDEVVVAGEEGYREAKEFMRLLMPNQIRNVIAYRDPQPIFAKAGAEAQLDAMFSNQVVLKSGGYLVINQTEALVAIDVNSGRSTREHNIEDTAFRTNLEAADEIARQLRLRDLAGLIVVDFIDMEESRNDKAVERRLKDALKNDRARIQIGRISHFGLLEMSRQRMRTGVLEGSTVMCPHCAGSGSVRSVSSMALHVLRLLEEALLRSAAYNLVARTRSEVALYILNQKRANLLDLESRFGVAITVLSDPAMTGMVYHAVERGAEATPPQFLPFRPAAAPPEADESGEEIDAIEDSEADEVVDAGEETGEVSQPREKRGPDSHREAMGEGEGGRRRRRRRRRRGRDGLPLEARQGEVPHDDGSGGFEDGDGQTSEAEELTDIEAGFLPESSEEMLEAPPVESTASAAEETAEASAAEAPESATAEAPPRRRTRRTTRGAVSEATPDEADATSDETAPPARRARRSRSRTADLPLDLGEGAPPPAKSTPREPELPLVASVPEAPKLVESAPVPAAVTPAAAPAVVEAEPDPDRPKRSGWWQRAKATFSAGS